LKITVVLRPWPAAGALMLLVVINITPG